VANGAGAPVLNPADESVLGTAPHATKGDLDDAGSLPAIMNAVLDALSEYGIRHIDMPATPLKVWQAIRDAQAARSGGTA
jgi:CO/xanthine dehydrogenase Mo-binding subunit